MQVNDIFDTYKGRIELDMDILYHLDIKTTKEIFSRIIPIRAENDFISNKVTYWAISEEFREVEEGETIPFYEVEITEEENEEGEVINCDVKFVEREG